MNNFVQPGEVLDVAVTHPTTPTSGIPVRMGTLPGAATAAEDSAGNTRVQRRGVVDVSVKGIDDTGNSAVAVFDPIYYVDADTPVLSKKASGKLYGYALEIVASGATTTVNVLLAEFGSPPPSGGLSKGTIPLDIFSAHILATADFLALSEGGFADTNTAPLLERVNSGTDIAARLSYVADNVVEIQFAPVVKPQDLDESQDISVHLMMAKDANTDTAAVVTVKVFDGVGDTTAGGNTAALAVSTLAEYSVVVAAADIAAAPGFLNISLVPGAHANDAEYLYAAWIEYSRKA